MNALRRYVSREFYYVMHDLITRHGWKQIDTFELWNGATSLRDKLLYKFGELPTSILFWEGYQFLKAHERPIAHLDARKAIFADDLHYSNESMKMDRLIAFALCQTVLATYAPVWNEFYPEFRGAKRVVWVPHSASPDFVLAYNQFPENSILLSGAMTYHYPLRQQMKALHDRSLYAIAYHAHPGYHCSYDYQNDENVGRGYAERLNRYRTGFTDSLIYRYVVAKFFEIPATGALLLADATVADPLSKLGFIEWTHYVSVTPETVEEKIRYVLDERNHEELDRIRKRGQDLVLERHKTSDRADQINAACAAA